jgi:hypothetical protein
MTTELEAKQERDWQILHDRITATLDRFGQKNAFGKGDYWLVDDNWGRFQQQLEFQNLNLLQPHIIKALQELLAGYPDWEITVRIDVPGKEKIWPGMGIIIYNDEIIDELQRQYFPEEFRNYTYEGSKRRF